ncbi:hypothetical protein Tco_0174433 [Tanacetum coccineum]
MHYDPAILNSGLVPRIRRIPQLILDHQWEEMMELQDMNPIEGTLLVIVDEQLVLDNIVDEPLVLDEQLVRI